MHPLLKLHQALNTREESVPKGFKTAEQWAKQFGFKVQQSRKILRDLIKNKAIEVSKFRIATGTRIQLVPHYRQIK